MRSGGLLLEEWWDAVTYDAVGVNCTNGVTTNVKGAGVPIICAKGCVLGNCA